ncbi:MAG: ATP-dependent Clp protease adaptor ClpS [Spirochaetaceae bacterium]|jgi:ATP-dependent Clp protease adaptor protein ClpS|nr:ATP-dependent Clp protease adaptor ClpS [Spirochaetaceae bacterium]
METSLKKAVTEEKKLSEPENFKVILLNDDYTSMNFVVDVIMLVFHKNAEEAEQLMLAVHNKGRAIIGVYAGDIAKTKVDQVHSLAVRHDFPLQCIMERA